MRKQFCILFLALLCGSCLKEGQYDERYVLKPWVQTLSTAAAEPLEGVVAYAYAADTTLWGIASYEDALAGRISLKEDPSQQRTQPDAVAVPYEGDLVADTPQPEAPDPAEEGGEAVEPPAALSTAGWLQMQMGRSAWMVVAVDPASRIYAYTQQEPALNLPDLYVSFVFQPWRESKTYKSGSWSVYNPFYEPPTVLKCFFSPRMQRAEGEEEQEFASSQFKAYAFAADTTDWYIASYDDAAAGRITDRTDPEKTLSTPNFQAYPEAEGGFGMEVTTMPLMVVAVDRVNRIYAYTKVDIPLDSPSPTWPLLFAPWREEWSYRNEAGWRIVNENRKPENNLPDA